MYRGVALSFVVYEQQGREKDLPAYLAEIAVGGFVALEMRLETFFGSKEATEATSVALRVDNQKMLTGYADAALDEPTATSTLLPIATAAERAKARDLDTRGVVLVPLAGDRARTPAEIALATERITSLASSLARRGLWLALHNDAAESRDGATAYRALLDATAGNPAIGCAVDVEWLVRGGSDPVAFLSKYKDRIKTLHLRQSHGGVWSEDFGDGDVDYKAVNKLVRPLKTETTLVVELNYGPETKQTRRLVDDLKMSRQYVQRVLSA